MRVRHADHLATLPPNMQYLLDLEQLRLQKMDIGGYALVTVITYFFCDLWRSGPLSTLREFTRILSRSATLYFTRFSLFSSLKMALTNENSSSIASLASQLLEHEGSIQVVRKF